MSVLLFVYILTIIVSVYCYPTQICLHGNPMIYNLVMGNYYILGEINSARAYTLNISNSIDNCGTDPITIWQKRGSFYYITNATTPDSDEYFVCDKERAQDPPDCGIWRNTNDNKVANISITDGVCPVAECEFIRFEWDSLNIGRCNGKYSRINDNMYIRDGNDSYLYYNRKYSKWLCGNNIQDINGCDIDNAIAESQEIGWNVGLVDGSSVPIMFKHENTTNNALLYCDIIEPTPIPTETSETPTLMPTPIPSNSPSIMPSVMPTNITEMPTKRTYIPTDITYEPTWIPTTMPSQTPSESPTHMTEIPTKSTYIPTNITYEPTSIPTVMPSQTPSESPTQMTEIPNKNPTLTPIIITANPSIIPTQAPSSQLQTATDNVTTLKPLNDTIPTNDNIKLNPNSQLNLVLIIIGSIILLLVCSLIVCMCILYKMLHKRKAENNSNSDVSASTPKLMGIQSQSSLQTSQSGELAAMNDDNNNDISPDIGNETPGADDDFANSSEIYKFESMKKISIFLDDIEENNDNNFNHFDRTEGMNDDNNDNINDYDGNISNNDNELNEGNKTV